MSRPVKHILFSLYLVLFSTTARSQIYGGEINYSCQGNDQFEVTAILYASCGYAQNVPSIYCLDGNDTLQVSGMHYVGRDEMNSRSQGCSFLDSCNISSEIKRMFRYSFSGTIDLSNRPACTTTFYLREPSINFTTTLNRPDWFFIQTQINRCLDPCGQSICTQIPLPTYCEENEPFQYNPGKIEYNCITDSVTFEIIPVKTDFNTQAQYIGNRSPKKFIPATVYNQHVWDTITFHSYCGSILFKPIHSGDKSSIVLKVNRLKKINGSWQLVSMQELNQALIVVDSSGNKMPRRAYSTRLYFCTSRAEEIKLGHFDDDSTDETRMNFYHPSYMNFIEQAPRFSPYEEKIYTWEPDTSKVEFKEFYYYYQEVFDNRCPLNGRTSTLHNSYVEPTYVPNFIVEDIKPCDSVRFRADLDPDYPTLRVYWGVYGIDNNYYQSVNQFEGSLSLPKGRYRLYQYSSIPGRACGYSTHDSIEVTRNPIPEVSFTDHFITGCEGKQDSIGVLSTVESCTFTWSNGSQDSLLYITLGKNPQFFAVTVRDSFCSRTDSFWTFPSPVPTQEVVHHWIGKDVLALQVPNPDSSTRYTWYLDGSPSYYGPASRVFIAADQDSNHTIYLQSQLFRCTVDTTFKVSPYNGIPGMNKNHIRVYPNPFSNTLNINISGEVHLYNLLGDEMEIRIREEHGETTVSGISRLAPGYYILSIQNSDGLFRIKVLKH